MDDATRGFFVGLVTGLFCVAMLFLTPLVGFRSSFQKEAVGNGCGELICTTDGACAFIWTCDKQ
jgi:hypothetical protein